MSSYDEKLAKMSQPELALELCEKVDTIIQLKEDAEKKLDDSKDALRDACSMCNELIETLTPVEEEAEEDENGEASMGVQANIVRTDKELV